MPRQRQQPAVTAPVEDVDLPPDRHPARRPVLALLLLATLVLIVRAGWGWIADRRLNAVRADLERHGLFAHVPAPVNSLGKRDAYYYLDQASRSDVQGAWYFLMQARKAGAVSWPPLPIDAPGQRGDAIAASGVYWLGRELEIGASQAHASREDRIALEYIRDIVYVSHAWEGMHIPIGASYGAVASVTALRAIDDIVSHLHIDTTPGSYDRSEIQGLIHDLSDDQGGWARLASAQRTEIRYTWEWITACRTGRRARVLSRRRTADGVRVKLAPEWANRATAWLAAPYYALQGARVLESEAVAAEAYDSGEYATVMQSLPALRPPFQRDGIFGVDWVTREFATVDQPRTWIPWYADARMMSRLAAVHVAAFLYARDHSGSIPPTLDALVPDYLPAIPQDLFARGGARIKYVPTAAQPFVYSIGENGIDDFAAGIWNPAAGIPFRSRLTMPDLISYVAPAGPVPVPATTTQRAIMRSSARARPRRPVTAP